ncbi:hypothetical protein BKH46_02245 [Helicobacter sp. 12S02634-8]|uniref:outer membrane beta-barrel protein n=1 Tax=Helicobacter sp. 12S02634-8 TaxID=1476199 RepID=UPI000BA6688F|nr:hypothetical protein [Helicobacter sp. 12S02634-8]PAF48148.1 hypothetical protein BKH46_02245 [Helicobacter sp. 12S02634-8]
MINKLKIFGAFVFSMCVLEGQDFWWFRPYGTLSMGLVGYTYKEPDLMSVSGPMGVLSGMGGLRFNRWLKSDLELYYATDMGRNIYDGAIQTIYNTGRVETIPVKSRSSDYYWGVAYRVGLNILANERDDILGLYTGLGYRYLHNQIHGIGAYLREQSYLYWLIGPRLRIRINEHIRLKADGELRVLLTGRNTSHMTDIGYDNNLHFTQSGGMGARVALGAEFFVSKKLALFVQGTFDYWGVDASDKRRACKVNDCSLFVEPANSTIAYGVEVGLSY